MSKQPQKQLDKSFSLTRREQKQEWGAAPPPGDKKTVNPNTPKCAACGRYHTVPGVTHESAEKDCLAGTVKRQREEIASLQAEVASLKNTLRLERYGRGDEPVESEPKKP